MKRFSKPGRSILWLAFSALLALLTSIDLARADDPKGKSAPADSSDEKDKEKDNDKDEGEKDKEPIVFDIADGKFQLTTPAGWERKEPASRIVEHEFEAPAAEGDERPGRVTVMGAGGSIEDNLNRWYAQFTQPDGSSTKEKAGEPEKLSAADQEIMLVDIPGTFLDKPPRAAKGIEREGYRMLGAIIKTKKYGLIFIKLVGPEKTIEENKKPFEEMLKGLKAT